MSRAPPLPLVKGQSHPCPRRRSALVTVANSVLSYDLQPGVWPLCPQSSSSFGLSPFLGSRSAKTRTWLEVGRSQDVSMLRISVARRPWQSGRREDQTSLTLSSPSDSILASPPCYALSKGCWDCDFPYILTPGPVQVPLQAQMATLQSQLATGRGTEHDEPTVLTVQ